MSAIRFIWLTVAFKVAWVICQDRAILGDLSDEIVVELKHLRTYYTLQHNGVHKRPQKIQTALYLYTRNNRDIPICINGNNTHIVEKTKKTIMVIHGWLNDSYSSGILQLKEAYLKRYDCNVILVDWSQMALQSYTNAFRHILKISNSVAKYLCDIDIPLSDVHVVGHSMGAQIAGIAGQFVNTKCKQQIGRITALDPSGPMFQNAPDRLRLDKTDAIFVDVIHTDQMRFGYSGNCGTVDFHPNCGQLQPGCHSLAELKNDTLLSDVFCSHHRSLEYMVESVRSNQFIAVSCGMCPRACQPSLISEVYVVMGEDFRATHRSSNKFYLTTASSFPYAKGWDAYNIKLS